MKKIPRKIAGFKNVHFIWISCSTTNPNWLHSNTNRKANALQEFEISTNFYVQMQISGRNFGWELEWKNKHDKFWKIIFLWFANTSILAENWGKMVNFCLIKHIFFPFLAWHAPCPILDNFLTSADDEVRSQTPGELSTWRADPFIPMLTASLGNSGIWPCLVLVVMWKFYVCSIRGMQIPSQTFKELETTHFGNNLKNNMIQQ